jgi:hypothetical protein
VTRAEGGERVEPILGEIHPGARLREHVREELAHAPFVIDDEHRMHPGHEAPLEQLRPKRVARAVPGVVAGWSCQTVVPGGGWVMAPDRTTRLLT